MRREDSDSFIFRIRTQDPLLIKLKNHEGNHPDLPPAWGNSPEENKPVLKKVTIIIGCMELQV